MSRFAEEELLAMLHHPADTPRHSAVYVYAHASQEAGQLTDAVQAVLARGDAATADMFVRSAVNMPKDRLDALFAHLDIIWTSGTWRERQHIIELLERLSVRSPEEVARFLQRHAVVDVVMRTKGAVSAVARVLVRTFAGVASSASAEVFTWVTRLLEAAPPNRGGRRPVAGREMYASVLSTLAEPAVADAFGATDLATRLIPVLTRRLAQIREGERIFHAYGAIWTREWQAGQLDAAAVLAGLDHEHPVVESAQYHGLVDALMPASEAQARLALQLFLSEPLQRRFLWASVVIPRLLQRWANTATTDSSPAQRPPIIDTLVRWIASQLARPLPEREGTDRQWRSDAGVLARRALENAHLKGQPLREILDAAGSIDRGAWLDKDRLAGLLASAALTGHPTAVDALASARADPSALANGVAYRVVNALQERLRGEPSAEAAPAAEAFLDVCLGTDDADRIAEWLPSLAATAPAVASGRAADLGEAAQRLLGSRSALTRRGAARLWLVLLQQRLIPSPPLAAVRHRLDIEHDTATTAVLLRVIACAGLASNEELQMARELLDAAVAEAEAAVQGLRPGLGPAERQGVAVGQEHRRNQAVLALTELFVTHIEEVGVAAVIEAATRRPVAMERIEICSRLAERLIGTDRATEGATIIRAWGRIGVEEKSGTKVRKNIAAHLRPALSALFRRAPARIWTDLLLSLVDFDEHFARAVVDAACREQFLAALPVLVGLLDANTGDGEARKALPSRVRRVILSYRHERERARGNAGWPELLDAFRALAPSPS